MTEQLFVPENPSSSSAGEEAGQIGPTGWRFVLKSEHAVAVLDKSGDIVPGVQGLYVGSTRYVSKLRLLVDGDSPVLLHAAQRRDGRGLAVHLTDRAREAGTAGLPNGALHVSRAACFVDGCYREVLSIVSYHDGPRDLHVTYEIGSDFCDLFEVRGIPRTLRGDVVEPRLTVDAVEHGYRGLDARSRRTVIRFSPEPRRLDANGATIALALERGVPARVTVEIEALPPEDAGPLHVTSAGAPLPVHAPCAIETSDGLFDRWVQRSRDDLEMLVTHVDGDRYPFAGLPWFSTAFGRDGILTALFALWFDPSLAKGVLRFLARHQAHGIDAARDAEPGKIVHELRDGEMAALGEIPFAAYYGSVDATPLFVVLLDAYVTTTADDALAAELWPHAKRALEWLASYGDVDGDGFIEYPRTAHGLVNQGWKDAPDAIVHADGRNAEGAIALCEVQGYAYAAWLAGARLARVRREPALAADLERRARALREDFDAAFFSEELGTFALALDGEKRRCEVAASNAGHCLWSGIVAEHRIARVTSALFGEGLFSGWGIRTLSSRAARYNPMSYHRGSVWPHDNALIALGLSATRQTALAARLLETFFQVSASFTGHRLPELFCGFAREEGDVPTPYPSACSPQAWAAASVFAFLDASLGMRIDGRSARVELHHPALPPELEEVRIRRLSVGSAVVDLLVHRHRGTVGASIERSDGGVELVVSE